MQVIIDTGLDYLWEVQRRSAHSYLVHKSAIATVMLCNTLSPAHCVAKVSIYFSVIYL